MALFDTVQQFFVDDDWKTTQVEGKTILRMGFRGENGNYTCFAQVREDQQQVMFYAVLESNAPEHLRPEVAEFITRANYGLRIGNFEMDYSDGEVRYKSSFDIEGGELTHLMMKNLVYANLLTMDRYFPGLMAVLYGGKDPEQAIKDIEG